jgi:hypothetical protein
MKRVSTGWFESLRFETGQHGLDPIHKLSFMFAAADHKGRCGDYGRCRPITKSAYDQVGLLRTRPIHTRTIANLTYNEVGPYPEVVP